MVLLFSILLLSSTLAAQSLQPVGTTPCNVRVLLDEKQFGDNTVWEIRSNEKLCACDPTDVDNHLLAKAVRISVRHGLEVVDTAHRILPKTSVVRIQSKDNLLKLNDRWYQGTLYAIIDNKKVLLINSLDIEDYIATVLHTESYPGWPLEMNKAMAITCRSYALNNIMTAEKAGQWYHLKATNAHQTYSGHRKLNPIIHQAVTDSQGLFLTHRDQPILAMYDICCGGVIPSKRIDVNKRAHPYLGRTNGCHYCKVDAYCKKTKSYQWEVRCSFKALEDVVKKEFPHIKKFTGIKIAGKDHAGMVQKVALKSAHGHHEVSVKKLSTLLKTASGTPLKSHHFDLRISGDLLTFDGRGFGHCLGLCQWGGREMIRRGHTHREVLAFYYPGCSIAQLERESDHAEL